MRSIKSEKFKTPVLEDVKFTDVCAPQDNKSCVYSQLDKKFMILSNNIKKMKKQNMNSYTVDGNNSSIRDYRDYSIDRSDSIRDFSK